MKPTKHDYPSRQRERQRISFAVFCMVCLLAFDAILFLLLLYLSLSPLSLSLSLSLSLFPSLSLSLSLLLYIYPLIYIRSL